MANKRPMFICSAITECQQTANCCPHRIPHIKDERCIPKQCRFVPEESNPVDCVPYDAQALLAEAEAKIAAKKEADNRLAEDMKKIEDTGSFVPLKEAEKELGITGGGDTDAD
jgi:hypothetical protein